MFLHRNGLLVHVVHDWCIPRLHQEHQQRTVLSPVYNSEEQRTDVTHQVRMNSMNVHYVMYMY